MNQKVPKLSELGLIHVITGNGKGKTTSALGLALRAAGHGFRVLIICFMKKGWNYGELKALKVIPGITILEYGTPEFIEKGKLKEIDLQEANSGLERTREAILHEEWDVLILDEINIAIDYGLLFEEDVIALIKQKPKNLELILTGRYASSGLIELADYHIEVCAHKHPFQQNVLARRGIEY